MAIGVKVVKGNAQNARRRRHFRVRKKVVGTSLRPRLVVSRSSRHLVAQIVDDAIGQNLGIMDATAFALCRDQKLPIKVFSIFKNGALRRVVLGEDEGTLVHV